MYITLRHVERILATQPVSIAAMRGAPGWESIADAYQTLTNHAAQLEEWSEQRADEEEERLRAYLAVNTGKDQFPALQKLIRKQIDVTGKTAHLADYAYDLRNLL